MRNANGTEQSSYAEMRGPALHHRRHRECLGDSAKTVSANFLETNRHCLMKLPRLGRILRHESLNFPFPRRLAHQIDLRSLLQ